jgi:predicted O-methyltransferase YrrM
MPSRAAGVDRQGGCGCSYLLYRLSGQFELSRESVLPQVADVKAVVGDLPFMTVERAEVMTDLIDEFDVRDVLELGFSHGVSTCYIAAALAERGDGHVVTIDRAARILSSPPLERLLEELALMAFATIFYEFDSYNWRLYHFLAQQPRPEFDLIYLDGAHTWSTDALAFLLTERLLSPGGLIVFDAMHWSFAASDSTKEHTAAMPRDERELEQVKLVFDQLVTPHPNIDETWQDGVWGYAHKRGTRSPDLALRAAALALIDEQAKEVFVRSETAIHSGEWTYRPWPQWLLSALGSPGDQELEGLRALVDRLKAQRAALEAQRDSLLKAVDALELDRARLMNQLQGPLEADNRAQR